MLNPNPLPASMGSSVILGDALTPVSFAADEVCTALGVAEPRRGVPRRSIVAFSSAATWMGAGRWRVRGWRGAVAYRYVAQMTRAVPTKS